jgi:hypothetical protein
VHPSSSHNTSIPTKNLASQKPILQHPINRRNLPTWHSLPKRVTSCAQSRSPALTWARMLDPPNPSNPRISHAPSGAFHNNIPPHAPDMPCSSTNTSCRPNLSQLPIRTNHGIQELSEHPIHHPWRSSVLAAHTACYRVTYDPCTSHRNDCTTLPAVNRFQNLDIKPTSQCGEMQTKDVNLTCSSS